MPWPYLANPFASAPARPAPMPQRSVPAAALFRGNPFGTSPTLFPQQGANEPLAAYGPRALFELPVRALDIGVRDAAQGITELGRTLFETPAAKQERVSKGQSQPAADQASPGGGGLPQDIVGFFKNKGYTVEQAQGIAAGIMSESGGDPNAFNPAGGGNGAFGLGQWRGDRLAGLRARYGPNPTKQQQLEYLDYELRGGDRGGASVLAQKTPEGVLSTYLADFMRPGIEALPGGIKRGLQALGKDLNSIMTNPYDPRYDQAAMGQLDAQRQALMTPWSINTNVGPAPELPTPEPLPTTDFSAADAALEQLRPIEMSEKEKLTRERDGYFSGLAQAMMNMPDNEGLGTFFMRLGGAALGGRMQARDEIRREADKFDEKMARFNAAIYENEMGKAQTYAREATAQVQQNNQFNHDKWTLSYNRWLGNGKVDISGTTAVITTTDEQGNRSVRGVPIGPAVDAAIAGQKADLFSSVGARAMAGNNQITGMTNAIVGRAAIEAMSGGGGTGSAAERDAAAAAAPAFYGTFIATNGLTADLLGAEGAQSLEKSVQQQLQGLQLIPGSKEYLERHDRIVANELAKLGIADPKIMQKMIQVGGTASSFEALDAVQSRKQRTSTNARGQTTTTTTMNASDIFE